LEDKELSIEKLAESFGIADRSIERNISLLKEKKCWNGFISTEKPLLF